LPQLACLSQHLANAKVLAESGVLKMGGGLLDELPGPEGPPKMCGSAFIVVAETRDEVVRLLETDVYVTSGVWDLEKAQIWPMLTAFRQS